MANMINDLKNLSAFNCPICLLQYPEKIKIFQCVNGHDICESCSSKVTNCPQCRGDYSGTRNFSLENVIQALNAKNEDTSTTTGNEVPPLEQYGPINYKKNLFGGPNQGRGLFKCRYTDCEANEPICRLLNHVRSFHNADLIQVGKEECEKSQYCHQFDIEVKTFCRVYQISNFGLFYFKMDVENTKESSKMYLWVQMAAPETFAKKIRYMLNVMIGDTKYGFNDIPHTVKMDSAKIKKLDNCLNIPLKPNSPKTISIDLKIRENKGIKQHLKKQTTKKMRT